MTKEKVVKTAFSVQGWDIVEFIKGRKKLIVTLVGMVGGWLITGNPALTAIVGAATELVYAVLEYFVKERMV